MKVGNFGARSHSVIGDEKVVYLIQKLHIRQHRRLPVQVAMNELGRVALALFAQHVEFQGNRLTLAQRHYRRVKYFVGLAGGHVALHAAHLGHVGIVLVAQGFVGVVLRGLLGTGHGAGDGGAERNAGGGKEEESEWEKAHGAKVRPTRYLSCPTDICAIQELLGHASIKTTGIYTHVAQRTRVASPLDDLGL